MTVCRNTYVKSDWYISGGTTGAPHIKVIRTDTVLEVG